MNYVSNAFNQSEDIGFCLHSSFGVAPSVYGPPFISVHHLPRSSHNVGYCLAL